MRGLRDWLAGWKQVVIGNGLVASARLARELYRQHGPTGTLARTRQSGFMAFWMALILLAFLVFSFF